MRSPSHRAWSAAAVPLPAAAKPRREVGPEGDLVGDLGARVVVERLVEGVAAERGELEERADSEAVPPLGQGRHHAFCLLLAAQPPTGFHGATREGRDRRRELFRRLALINEPDVPRPAKGEKLSAQLAPLVRAADVAQADLGVGLQAW